ncbi:hypothetical protein PM082_021865 [Marasmius tenuissimus]|nr:hypothetical protein PM082_021865 [Marasmius tenuissimus]
MKSPALLAVFAIAATTVFGQGNPNYGIVSPVDTTSVSAETPLNVTFNPGRYFKESTSSIDVFIIDNRPEAKSGKSGDQLVTGMTSNTRIAQVGATLETDAYHVDIDLSGLRSKLAGEKTVLIKETYNAFGGGRATAFWAQTFQFTN